MSEEEEKSKKEIVVVPQKQYEEAKKILGISKEDKSTSQTEKESENSEDSSKDEIIEDLTNKLTMVAEKELERKMRTLAIPESQKEFFRENPQALKGYELAKEGKVTPSGTAPLSSQGLKSEEGFDSVEEMIDTLRTIQKFGESAEERKEAKLILNELLTKTILGLRKEKSKTIEYTDESKIPLAERENIRLGLRKPKKEE